MSRRKNTNDNFDKNWAKKQQKKLRAEKGNKTERSKERHLLKSYEKEYSGH